jgi:8-oxo-dGTP pyrophosphatase MutT (NUDIX family)
MNPKPRYRLTSRSLLLNARDKVLLFEYEDDHTDVNRFWVTPGGGVEPGETFAQAAIRELHEETGLEVENVGEPVWFRRKLVRCRDHLEDIEEFYFLVRVDSVNVIAANPDEYERSTQSGYQWWSLEALRQCHETVFPDSLAVHLEPILRGEIPSNPLDISPHPNPPA